MVEAFLVASDVATQFPHTKHLGGIGVLLVLTDALSLGFLKGEDIMKLVKHILRTSRAHHLASHLLMHLLAKEVHLTPHIVLHCPHGEVLDVLAPFALSDIEHHRTQPGTDHSSIAQFLIHLIVAELGRILGLLVHTLNQSLSLRQVDHSLGCIQTVDVGLDGLYMLLVVDAVNGHFHSTIGDDG